MESLHPIFATDLVGVLALRELLTWMLLLQRRVLCVQVDSTLLHRQHLDVVRQQRRSGSED